MQFLSVFCPFWAVCDCKERYRRKRVCLKSRGPLFLGSGCGEGVPLWSQWRSAATHSRFFLNFFIFVQPYLLLWSDGRDGSVAQPYFLVIPISAGVRGFIGTLLLVIGKIILTHVVRLYVCGVI